MVLLVLFSTSICLDDSYLSLGSSKTTFREKAVNSLNRMLKLRNIHLTLTLKGLCVNKLSGDDEV